MSSFRGRRSALDLWCCVFFANHTGRAALSSDKVQIAWQAWCIMRMSFLVAGAAFG